MSRVIERLAELRRHLAICESSGLGPVEEFAAGVASLAERGEI